MKYQAKYDQLYIKEIKVAVAVLGHNYWGGGAKVA